MPRRIAGLLAALVAATTLTVLDAPTGLLAAEPAEAAGAEPATAATAVEEEGTDPLQVDIDSITPGVVPQSGPVLISGTVTNVDTETWTTVNLYSFISGTPITTPEDLAAAADLPAETPVGERVVEEGATATIAEIAPGDTLSFSFEVRRADLPVSEPGVYWFGVQALGQGPLGRDLVADGRARTFLPLVDTTTAPLDLAVVVPLRRRIQVAEDGRIDDLPSWTSTLSSGGRLRALVDLGVSASSRQVTYLLDPALLASVRQLAAGNPARSLRPTLPEDAGQGADAPEGEESDAPAPTDDASVVPDPDQATDDPAAQDDPGVAVPDDPETAEAQAAAADWLDRLDRAVAGHEVLALPYGDLDVAAAADHGPQTYADARARSTQVLDGAALPSTPAVSAPGGYLDTNGLLLTELGETVLVSDAMFTGVARDEGSGSDDRDADTDAETDADGTGTDPEASTVPDPATYGGVVPTVVTDAGRRAVVASEASLEGDTAGAARTLLSVRQRTLAEAALRAGAEGSARQPLVLVLPNDWNPGGTSGFFSGLDVAWLELQPVSSIAAGTATPVSWDDLDYPRLQTRTELPGDQFQAADRLARAGTRLQNLLTRNDQVARTVADQALTTLSYTSRSDPARSRADATASTTWIQDRLGRVGVEAPRAFTMTGTSSSFSATVVNDLPQPVTVALRAEVDDGIEITPPTTIDVPASSRQRVLLRATAPDGGIHRVTLSVADADGSMLGDSDTLTIRSLQVSNVIWVFLGAAGMLLFGAIAFRLFRRIRAARRAARSGPPDAPGGPHDHHDPAPSADGAPRPHQGVGA